LAYPEHLRIFIIQSWPNRKVFNIHTLCNRFKELGAVIIYPGQAILEKYAALKSLQFEDHYLIIFESQVETISGYSYVQTTDFHINYEVIIDETTITYTPKISCWVKSGNTSSEEYIEAIESLSDLLPPSVQVKIPYHLLSK
jgi:hypothetical protein